jgi:D-sedoheptulose 7-phosphate isomerase
LEFLVSPSDFSQARLSEGSLGRSPVPALDMDPVDAYLRQMSSVVDALPREPIWAAVDLLVAAGRAGRRVYLIGNGGSAATASHMANDLCKQASVEGRPMLRAIALTDNMPLVTAWSNDEDYAECFARQLVNHVEPQDLVIAISASGNSPNVLRAIEQAKAIGAGTIGLTGGDGGALATMVDCCICVPSQNIGQQEDGHLIVNHVLATGIRARLLGD